MKVIISIIRWIISILMILFAVVSFSAKGGFVSGFLFLLVAAIANPIVTGILKKNKIRFKKVVLITSSLIFFIAGVLTSPSSENNRSVADNTALKSQELALVGGQVNSEIENNTLDRQLDYYPDNNIEETQSYVNSQNDTTDEPGIVFYGQSDEYKNEIERISQEQMNNEKAEQERLAQEEAEREKAEQERIAQEQAEKAEQERLALEKAEQERLAQEKAEQERIAQEQLNDQQQNQNNNGNSYNFNTYNNPDQQNTTDQWVLNTSTHKIHHPSCKDVKKIAPENYATSNLTIGELCSQGYSTCGHCFK